MQAKDSGCRSAGAPSFFKTYSSATCHVTLVTHDKCVLDCSILASNVLNSKS